MFKRSSVITMLVLVGLSTVAVAGAGMRSQRGGTGCRCCMGGMMRMGEMEESGEMKGMEGMGGMEGMAGMGHEEMAQRPLTEGRKKVGEEFTCPVDGMRMTVTENTPATEYRGKTYYFCDEQDKQAFLKDPEQYVKEKSAE